MLTVLLLAGDLRADEPRESRCIVPVRVNPTGVPESLRPMYTSSVREAVAHWNTVDADFTLEVVDWAFPADAHAGAITISMAPVEQLEEDQLALTWNQPHRTGIQRSRIHIDSETRYCAADSAPGADCVDMYTLVLHELGHSLGMKHSTNPSSVMFRMVGPPPRRSLTSDDVWAVQALYPWDAPNCGSTDKGGLVWGLNREL
jgi:predicted Zn-dependent protease